MFKLLTICVLTVLCLSNVSLAAKTGVELNYSKFCIEGVTYIVPTDLQSQYCIGFMSVKVGKDGNIELCDKEDDSLGKKNHLQINKNDVKSKSQFQERIK